jgi:hypothetical protein
VPTKTTIATPADGPPSAAIKSFHSQILRKAQEALVVQPVEEREFGCLTVAIDTADLPLFKKLIRDFRKSFDASAEARRRNRNELYSLSMQFFRVSEKEK